MSKQTVAEQYVDLLARAGVSRMYGVVGDSLNPVVDAVRRHDALEWIQVRHEEVAAFAAGAEAQLTGRLAACAGSCGPGNLHLINGLFDAHVDGTGHRAGRADSQQRDRYGVLPGGTSRPAVRGVQSLFGTDLLTPADAPGGADSDPARGRSARSVGGGPVRRHRRTGLPDGGAELAIPLDRPTVRPGDQELARLIQLVDAAEKVTVFCGRGVEGAHAECRSTRRGGSRPDRRDAAPKAAADALIRELPGSSPKRTADRRPRRPRDTQRCLRSWEDICRSVLCPPATHIGWSSSASTSALNRVERLRRLPVCPEITWAARRATSTRSCRPTSLPPPEVRASDRRSSEPPRSAPRCPRRSS